MLEALATVQEEGMEVTTDPWSRREGSRIPINLKLSTPFRLDTPPLHLRPTTTLRQGHPRIPTSYPSHRTRIPTSILHHLPTSLRNNTVVRQTPSTPLPNPAPIHPPSTSSSSLRHVSSNSSNLLRNNFSSSSNSLLKRSSQSRWPIPSDFPLEWVE